MSFGPVTASGMNIFTNGNAGFNQGGPTGGMVLAFGLDTIIISADRPKDPQASRYLENTATVRGKPSITAEAGYAGTVETDDLNALVNGCLNVMRYLRMLPGAPNVIPGKVVLSLELRDLDAAKIQTLFEKIRTEAGQIAQTSKVTFDFKEINVNIPAPTDPRIRNLIGESAMELGLSTKQMPSGAGHDAQDMARLAPVGMIFIPSIGGISHSPREFSRPADIANGANVLLRALLKVDRVNLA